MGVAMAIISLTGCEMMNSSNSHGDERSEGRALDDKNITAEVKKSMDQEPAFKFNGVSIKTFDGIVQLSGFVDTNSQKVRAQELAQRAEGVKEVINGIAIKPANTAATSRANESTVIYADPQNPAPPATTNDSNQQPK